MNTYYCTFAPNSDPDNIQRETLLADNIQQIERVYQANDCTLLHFDVKAETIEVAPWDEIPDAWQIEAEALAADAEDWMQQTVELRNQ